MNLEFNRGLNDALSKLYMPDSSSLLNKDKPIEEKGSSFGDIISNEISKLNHQQINADNMVQDLLRGEGEDLHSIMIATEEARLSLEMAVQVRNKLIEAFNQINNMQL